jgi:uncharacterized protein
MRSEDVLPDNVNEVSVAGVRVRKGSVAAFIANARILADQRCSEAARRKAETDIAELLPALSALGLFEVFAIRDSLLEALVDRLARGLPPRDTLGQTEGE